MPDPARAAARYARLVKICARRGYSLEDVREMVQEAHLRLYEYRRTARVRDEDSLLRRILIHLAINRYHRERKLAFVPASVAGIDLETALVDPAPDGERIIEAEQQLAAVTRLLSAVSRRTCQIFYAHRAGFSYQEIASEFGIGPRTVQKHIARATSLLRQAKADE